jgi:hypothetical protein
LLVAGFLLLVEGKEKRIKKLNRRDHRVRRGKNGQRLKAQGAREKALPFPTLP